MLLIFLRFINFKRSGRTLWLCGIFGVSMVFGAGAGAVEEGAPHAQSSLNQSGEHHAGPVHESVVANPILDRSGHIRRGKASFYARQFAGRKMADGTIMEPQGNNAASKTLPLGTTARVTNLENGRSAVVTIRDRGPYIEGRIVDLSPSTAKQIGIETKKGVAKVEVAPIVVPLPDGHIKLGAAVTDSNESIGRFALSTDRFARLSDAEPRDLIDAHMGH
jgi:rare lipoprotein A